MQTIYVEKEIKTPLAVTSAKAKYIQKLLLKAVDDEERVEVDFSNINTLTTAFLNVAIGDLYAKYDSDTLNKFIIINGKSLTALQREKVKLVMQNAKNKLTNEQVDKELYNG